jgi:hypothetical protein
MKMQQDPLLEKIAKLKAQDAQAEYNRRKNESERTSTIVGEAVGWFQKLFNFVFWLVEGFWRVFLRPFLKPVLWAGNKFINHLFKTWNKYAFFVNEFGNRKFAPIRAATLIVMLCLSYSAMFVVIDLTYYTSLFLLTHNTNEIVYMHNSQEVNPNADVYSAQGCETLPCDENSSIYFRIDPILFNHVYSVFHDGRIFYPDYLSAAIPPVITKCTITSYGIRVKMLMRGLDIYPYLLTASCQPLEHEAANPKDSSTP